MTARTAAWLRSWGDVRLCYCVSGSGRFEGSWGDVRLCYCVSGSGRFEGSCKDCLTFDGKAVKIRG